MYKEIIQYSSPLDALIAITKRLVCYEMQEQIDSKEFFKRYNQGQIEDSAHYVEWANDYRHYLEWQNEIENKLKHAA
jgi:hypothetical protein